MPNEHRIEKIENRLGTLESTLAAAAATVDALTGALERDPRPEYLPSPEARTAKSEGTNWTGIGLLVFAAIASVGSLAKYAIDSVDTKSMVNSEQIEKLRERELQDAYDKGYMKARQEDIDQHLRDVDFGKSRAWNFPGSVESKK